ncbi:MAG: EamA family transporter [Planctomycetota bacterium]
MICFLGTVPATALLATWGAVRFRTIRWGPVWTNAKSALSGILVFAVANVLSIAAMRDLSPGVVYSVVSSSTLWVGILSFLILKERWTRLQAGSAIVLFVGLLVLFGLAKQA